MWGAARKLQLYMTTIPQTRLKLKKLRVIGFETINMLTSTIQMNYHKFLFVFFSVPVCMAVYYISGLLASVYLCGPEALMLISN